MNKNVLIVNFNTQKLTEACIKSVNKFSPGCNIYIFDNSDKEPFVNTFDNVTVLDNTEGQIIDFDEWLENYPNRKHSPGKKNNWGSAKHTYTIEKCISLIPDGFVLLDSDVLLKRDFSMLFDEDFIYVGDVQKQPKSSIYRVLPYICFINSKMCIEKGVHYFDPRYMHGLRYKGRSDSYDTGGGFFMNSRSLISKKIRCDDYIVHFKSGSWVKDAEELHGKKSLNEDEWLDKYSFLFDDTPIDYKKINEIKPAEEPKPEPKLVRRIEKPSKPRRPEKMVSVVKVKSSARTIGLIKR